MTQGAPRPTSPAAPAGRSPLPRGPARRLRPTRRALGATLGAAGAAGGVPAALTACAGGGAPPSGQASRAPAAVRFTYRAGYELFDELGASFTQRHPHLTVTTEAIPGAEYF